MRGIKYILIILFLFGGLVENSYTQTLSPSALIRMKIFGNPDTWKLNRTVVNSFWDKDIFSQTKASAQCYIVDPNYNLYSIVTFHLDPSWNRLTYYERLSSWIRSYSSRGEADSQIFWPKSFDAHAIVNSYGGNYNYELYIADTRNNRIDRFMYDWTTTNWSYLTPISGNELQEPIDIDINNGGTFASRADDYLWVLTRLGKIYRISVEGQFFSSYNLHGCSGEPGTFCYPSAIVSGKSNFLTTPYEPYAHTRYMYVADTGNSRIVWLLKDENTEMLSWLGEVETSSTISDLETDNFGHIWAVDKEKGKFTKYSYDLTPLCTFGSSGIGSNQFIAPSNISNAGGYLAAANMAVSENWTDSCGLQRYTIGTDVVDFTVSSNSGNYLHYIDYVLVDPSRVELKIYNAFQQLVKTIYDATQFSGHCSFVWDGNNDSGEPVDTGYFEVMVKATCTYGTSPDEPTNIVTKQLPVFHTPSCCIGIRGNVDGDAGDNIDIADLVYLQDYSFNGGPEPPCMEEADLDAVDGVDISDLVYLVNYMYGGGVPPVDCL